MIKVDLASFTPIYEQIKKEIKREVALEILKPHEPLPSIRELAENLVVNPNTVARAYRELEQEGFIYTRKGKGCFVSDSSFSQIKKERNKVLSEIFDRAIDEAEKFKLNAAEMKRLFEERLEAAMKGHHKEGTNE